MVKLHNTHIANYVYNLQKHGDCHHTDVPGLYNIDNENKWVSFIISIPNQRIECFNESKKALSNCYLTFQGEHRKYYVYVLSSPIPIDYLSQPLFEKVIRLYCDNTLYLSRYRYRVHHYIDFDVNEVNTYNKRIITKNLDEYIYEAKIENENYKIISDYHQWLSFKSILEKYDIIFDSYFTHRMKEIIKKDFDNGTYENPLYINNSYKRIELMDNNFLYDLKQNCQLSRRLNQLISIYLHNRIPQSSFACLPIQFMILAIDYLDFFIEGNKQRYIDFLNNMITQYNTNETKSEYIHGTDGYIYCINTNCKSQTTFKSMHTKVTYTGSKACYIGTSLYQDKNMNYFVIYNDLIYKVPYYINDDLSFKNGKTSVVSKYLCEPLTLNYLIHNDIVKVRQMEFEDVTFPEYFERGKMNMKDIKLIRRLYRERKYNLVQLGELFGINFEKVSQIINNHLYREFDRTTLTKQQVAEIRFLYESKRYPFNEIVKMYDICDTIMNNIIKYRIYIK